MTTPSVRPGGVYDPRLVGPIFTPQYSPDPPFPFPIRQARRPMEQGRARAPELQRRSDGGVKAAPAPPSPSNDRWRWWRGEEEVKPAQARPLISGPRPVLANVPIVPGWQAPGGPKPQRPARKGDVKKAPLIDLHQVKPITAALAPPQAPALAPAPARTSRPKEPVIRRNRLGGPADALRSHPVVLTEFPRPDLDVPAAAGRQRQHPGGVVAAAGPVPDFVSFPEPPWAKSPMNERQRKRMGRIIDPANFEAAFADFQSVQVPTQKPQVVSTQKPQPQPQKKMAPPAPAPVPAPVKKPVMIMEQAPSQSAPMIVCDKDRRRALALSHRYDSLASSVGPIIEAFHVLAAHDDFRKVDPWAGDDQMVVMAEGILEERERLRQERDAAVHRGAHFEQRSNELARENRRLEKELSAVRRQLLAEWS